MTEIAAAHSHHWRSALYQVGNTSRCHTAETKADNSIQKEDESSSTLNDQVEVTVTVPDYGLYGFIFGTKKHGEHFEMMKRDALKKGKGKKTDGNDTTIHCGCMFKATFSVKRLQDDQDQDQDQGANAESTSILLPFTNPKSKNKLLTSTRVAKSIYLPKGTSISVEQIISCEKGDMCQWIWGMVLQKRYWYHDVDGSGSSCPSPSPSPQNKRPKIETESNSGLVDSNKTHSNDENEKKRVNRNSNFPSGMLVEKISLDPSESKKKPVLCSKCCRKFPTTEGIRNHCISAHAPKIGDTRQDGESDDDYYDLVGPEIFRTPLKYAYDDDDLVVVIKPQGVPVQGSRWTLPKTDLLMAFKTKLGRVGDLTKPRITHRLDSQTGGLLVVAKSAQAETNIKKAFEDRLCRKRYRAIVFGKLIQNQHKHSELINDNDVNGDKYTGMGVVDVPLYGKRSTTRYQIVKYTKCDHPWANGFITTVDLYPVTGRRHQLRRHLKIIGYPIWGDMRYAPYSKSDKIVNESTCSDDECDREYEGTLSAEKHPHSKMCLWALEISFPHPSRDEVVKASIEEPKWYEELRRSM